jgi:hypothetical protein
MEVSTEKSQMIKLLGQELLRGKIVVDNRCLQAKNFKYLGCEISYENKKAIQQKLAKFVQILGILNTKSTLVQVYKTFGLPILLYGSKIWTLRKKDKND